MTFPLWSVLEIRFVVNKNGIELISLKIQYNVDIIKSHWLVGGVFAKKYGMVGGATCD